MTIRGKRGNVGRRRKFDSPVTLCIKIEAQTKENLQKRYGKGLNEAINAMILSNMIYVINKDDINQPK